MAKTFGVTGLGWVLADSLLQEVDTNCAGDAFSGGFIFGLLENWNLDRPARFASAVAALKCRRLGNAGLPNPSEVEDFCATNAI